MGIFFMTLHAVDSSNLPRLIQRLNPGDLSPLGFMHIKAAAFDFTVS